MKKLISAFTMMFLCSLSYAESMKFITVLSSPVGTFNKLEAVDPAQPAKGNTVNFCTNIGTQGVVELKGTKPAALTTVSLSNNTTLGKTDEGKFSLSKIELHSGGNIRGGRLFGNTFTVNNAASGKANNVYGSQLTAAGAKTKTLDVNSGASKINGPGDSTGKEEMVWSNQYQSDDACKEGASYEKCKQQYLLKQKGTAVANKCPQTAGDPRTWWDENTQQCGCPNENEYYHNGACCSEANKEDSRCWSPYTWVNYRGDVAYNPSETGKSRHCTVVDGRLPYLTEDYSTVDKKYANAPVCKNNGPCTTPGDEAVNGCGFVEQTNMQGEKYYKAMIFISECRKGYGYGAWYDKTVDTRYSCGH